MGIITSITIPKIFDVLLDVTAILFLIPITVALIVVAWTLGTLAMRKTADIFSWILGVQLRGKDYGKKKNPVAVNNVSSPITERSNHEIVQTLKEGIDRLVAQIPKLPAKESLEKDIEKGEVAGEGLQGGEELGGDDDFALVELERC